MQVNLVGFLSALTLASQRRKRMMRYLGYPGVQGRSQTPNMEAAKSVGLS